jgi:hypothetical protein
MSDYKEQSIPEDLKQEFAELGQLLEGLEDTDSAAKEIRFQMSLIERIGRAEAKLDHRFDQLAEMSGRAISAEELLAQRDQTIADLRNSAKVDADLLVSGQKVVDELRTQLPAWISVKDRLPGYGEIVNLVCRGIVQYSAYIRDVGEYLSAVDDDADPMPESYVTHWMPLPEPPKPEVQ